MPLVPFFVINLVMAEPPRIKYRLDVPTHNAAPHRLRDHRGQQPAVAAGADGEPDAGRGARTDERAVDGGVGAHADGGGEGRRGDGRQNRRREITDALDGRWIDDRVVAPELHGCADDRSRAARTTNI